MRALSNLIYPGDSGRDAGILQVYLSLVMVTGQVIERTTFDDPLESPSTNNKNNISEDNPPGTSL